MSDGNSGIRHYGKLGKTCGRMVVSVRTTAVKTWLSQALDIINKRGGLYNPEAGIRYAGE